MKAKVGSAPVCGSLLQATWTACNVTVGGGNGPVYISLPVPTAVSAFTSSPAEITR